METITRLRQDEAIRFFKWIAEKTEEWGYIEQTLHESVRAMNMLKILEIIRKREFYFLLPIVIR